MNEQTAVSRADDQTTLEQPALLPPVDVIEDDSGITLYADLPGAVSYTHLTLPTNREV